MPGLTDGRFRNLLRSGRLRVLAHSVRQVHLSALPWRVNARGASLIGTGPMFFDEHAERGSADRFPAVGIVVHDNAPPPGRAPRIAFVWGGEDAATPSLPFGRWKPGARAA